jgi:hypothetical protein
LLATYLFLVFSIKSRALLEHRMGAISPSADTIVSAIQALLSVSSAISSSARSTLCFFGLAFRLKRNRRAHAHSQHLHDRRVHDLFLIAFTFLFPGRKSGRALSPPRRSSA